jgi:1-acyl-sn-glycerol-3-phosphate acyltransferase
MTTGFTPRKAWLMPFARRYVRRKLRLQFDGMLVEGLGRTRLLAQGQPLIVAPNHVAWWDPLVALHLDALLGTEGHCLMDEDNLNRYPFFGWVGAVPLARGANRRTLAHMQAAARLLRRPGCALWIFAQGRQRPAHLRPLAPASGVAWLSRRTGASVVPLALDYQYREAPEPAIFVSFGAPIAAAETSLTTQLEQAWIAGLARIDACIEAGTAGSEGFALALPPRRAPQRTLPLAGRTLARLLGGQRGRLGAGREESR